MDIAELADLARGVGGTVSHESAAALWGFRLRNDATAPSITVPRNRSCCVLPGVVVRRRDLAPRELRIRDGVPVTAPLRTALDLAGVLPHEDAVVSLDSALESRKVQAHQFEAALRRLRGPGAGRIRAALLAADGRSQSVPETLIRLWLGDDPRIGLVVPQMRLRNKGHPYDLGFPKLRTVAEYQSWEWHHERTVWVKDARWGNEAYTRGFGYVQVVHEDVVNGREHIRNLVLGLS